MNVCRPGGASRPPLDDRRRGRPARSRAARRAPARPRPSSTRPCSRIAPGMPGGTSSRVAGVGQGEAEERADGLARGRREGAHGGLLAPSGCGAAAGEHDVPAVAGAPLVLGDVVVVGGDQAVAGRRVGDRLVDRVEREERVAREVHLGDQPLGEVGAEQREVDVRRPPGVVVVAPRVGAGLDGGEPVAAVVVGQAAARRR